MSSLEDAIDLTDDHALAAGIYRSEQRAQLAAEQRRRAEAAMSAEEFVRELDEEDDDAGMPELVQGDAAALLAASAIAEATTAPLDVASTELHRFDAAYVPTVHQQQSDMRHPARRGARRGGRSRGGRFVLSLGRADREALLAR